MPALFLCLDGCSPEYLEGGSLGNIEGLRREGRYERALSTVPTVTNVNNVSLVTGEYPEAHGITANSYYDRATGSEVYMESSGFIRSETIFERAAKLGLKTALITAKEKLCTLLSRGAQVSVAAESPPPWLLEAVGQPPGIYSIEVNAWLFEAFKAILSTYRPDLVYLATTDYVMHKQAPREPGARRQMELIDGCIGELLGELKDASLYITADHGMSDKLWALDLEEVLKRVGIGSRVLLTIRDRYVEHHQNLSGSAYVYLEDTRRLERAYEALADTKGVEEVLTREEASAKYRLPSDRIGDLFVQGEREYVFGSFKDGVDLRRVSLRSHGSLHERQVPLIVYRAPALEQGIVENKNMALLILSQLKLSKREGVRS